MRKFLRFLRDCLDALIADDYDIRARKEADDKQRRHLNFLGSGR